MNLEELHEKAENDTTVDETGVGEFSLTLAHKTTQWLTILSEEKIMFEALTIQLGSIREKRRKYYKTDYETTLEDKQHLTDLLTGDDTINKIKSRYVICKEKISFIEGIIKNLNQASFNIRNFLEYKKFSNGGY
jgi:hypothetical protein